MDNREISIISEGKSDFKESKIEHTQFRSTPPSSIFSIISMCQHWEKNDPMEIMDGDSDDLILAKKALKDEMMEMGLDIHNSSTDRIVRAMNWTWQEGFIQGFLNKRLGSEQ